MAIVITNVKAVLTAPEGVNLVAVKVETSEPGLYGVGCATFTQRYLAVATVIEEYLKPLLIGKDPLRTEDLWQSLMGSSYWRNGPVLNNALSGVDIALWDIKGKLANMPLYQLLGGKCREGALAYTHVRGSSIERVLEIAQQKLEDGYLNLRCHTDEFREPYCEMNKPLGASDGAYYDPKVYMRATLDMFEQLRQHFGWDIGLCHDVHERLFPNDAANFAKEMEKIKLVFLEDPLPPEQVGWFEVLRQQTTIPIAVGELFNNPNEWINLISRRLIDYIRLHITQIGGITPARKVIALCDTFGVRTAWHGPSDITPIGHAVNIHLDLASPNFGIQEWLKDLEEPSLEVFPGAPYRKKGFLYVNENPGIGVDIDEKAAAKYPCVNTLPKWTMTRLPDGTSVRP